MVKSNENGALPGNNDDPARAKALDKALGDIVKRFGEGAIMRLGEADSIMQVDAIPTGAFSLDMALGIGGVPRGRVTDVESLDRDFRRRP